MERIDRSVNICVADPAGNITIFVLDRFERSEYADIAVRLLEIEEISGEQVAFVTGRDSMEMCGLEFCGNASRAFALMIAESDERYRGRGRVTVPVCVSGADGMLDVDADPDTGYASIEMPPYRSIRTLGEICGDNTDVFAAAFSDDFGGRLMESAVVDLGGIVHVIVRDVSASDQLFIVIRDLIQDRLDPPATGVMFMNGTDMIPIVYVKDVSTVYHEGSCCSGTTAAVIALSTGRPDGDYTYEIRQPAGTLTGSASVICGEVRNVRIGGTVRLEPPRTVSI